MQKNIKVEVDNNSILIRPYEATDKEAVLGLLRLNTPAFFAPAEEDDLVHYLDHEIEYYYVLEHEGAITGSGGFNFSEGGSQGKISWDLLHPHHQGKGLGTMLLEFRIKKLQEFKQVSTITVRTSQLVFKFYERCGFGLTHVVKDYWAEGFDLYQMQYLGRPEKH